MRRYLTRAEFTALQAGPTNSFSRLEVVVTDETSQPIYVYNTQTNQWDSLVTATTNPLTGGLTFSAGGDDITSKMGGSGDFNLLPYLTKGHLEGPSGGGSFAVSATGASGQTWQIQTVLETDFDAIQIGIFNSDASSVAGVTVSALPWSQVQANNALAANYNSATWTDLTFGGAATGTLAATVSGATQPSINWTDIVSLPSVARADSGKTLPGISVRVGFPTGVNYTYLPGPGATGSAWELDDAAVGNRPFRVRLQAVSAASNATKANLTATTTQTAFWPPILIRYWPRNAAARTLLLIGDSEASNLGATVSRYGWAQMWQAENSTPLNPIEIVGSSIGGASSSQILTNANAVVPAVQKATVIYPNGTPNATGSSIGSADVSTWRTMKAKLKALFESNFMKPIVHTMLPVNYVVKPWGATDSFRKGMNDTENAATNYKVFDMATAVSGGLDGNGQEIMTLTNDGLHPNQAGHVALKSKLASIITI